MMSEHGDPSIITCRYCFFTKPLSTCSEAIEILIIFADSEAHYMDDLKDKIKMKFVFTHFI